MVSPLTFKCNTALQVLKMPPTSHFLLAAAGLVDGAKKPGDEIVGAVSLKHIYEIAKVRFSCTWHNMQLLLDFLLCRETERGTVHVWHTSFDAVVLEQCMNAIRSAALAEICASLQVKQKDQPENSLQSVCKSVMGSAKCMGIKVVRSPEDA